MKKLVATMVVTVAVLTYGASTRLRAHAGHDHKVMGTVTAATANRIVLKDTAGKDVTVEVTKDTKVRASQPIKIEQIKPGTRVVITAFMEKDQTMKAKLIEVGSSPTATK